MAQKLEDWRTSAPMAQETGVESATEFFDMNYWQAIMMLFRPSMDLPNMLKQKFGTTHKIICRGQGLASQQDEEAVFLTLADAGQHILRRYRRLQRRRLLSYPYLATHHLFLSGKHRRTEAAEMFTDKTEQLLCYCTLSGIPRPFAGQRWVPDTFESQNLGTTDENYRVSKNWIFSC